ncbi:MAG: hypothetical protein EBR09_01685 [Proteobacteria bacterium]|nr:hypothetical protein [Pseudomonadota bacterium]
MICGIASFFLYSHALAQAELSRSLDLRIEIDKNLNSSRMCQNLVRMHENKNFAPWGLIFSNPSHFCSFPAELSKSYGLFMWRLVVTEWPEHVSFVMCRPTRPSDVLNEDCSWRIHLKKDSDLIARLQREQILFQVVAALHEKLPMRSFDLHGENYARPEPRLKSPVLENPPRLMKSDVRVEEPSGRLLITPLTFVRQPRHSAGVWFVSADPMTARHAAMVQLLAQQGLEVVELPSDTPVNKPAGEQLRSEKLKRLGQSKFADSRTESGDKTRPPLAAPAPKKPAPLNVMELSPSVPYAQPKPRRVPRTPRGNLPSVFADDRPMTFPDDTDVIKLEGAAAEEERSRRLNEVPMLTKLWDVLWNGLWKAGLDASGMPVQESERSRLPSTQSIAFRAWHPFWRMISLGFEAKNTQEKEHLDLKLSVQGSSLYQQARGQRSTTIVTSSLLTEIPTDVRLWRLESRLGLVFINEDWTYDRSKSTYEIWMPSKRGIYFEPLIATQPSADLSGFTARAGWGLFSFDNGQGEQWSAEAGWQWPLDENTFKWSKLKIPVLQTFAGLQQGIIRKSGQTSAAGNVDSLALNSFTLGLRLNFDELD